MLSKAELEFVLRLTDWFHGHWEDPGWGRRYTSQILIALAVRELATGLQDAKLRGQIQTAADEVIEKSSRGQQESSGLEAMTA